MAVFLEMYILAEFCAAFLYRVKKVKYLDYKHFYFTFSS